jgi:hypothetical protein
LTKRINKNDKISAINKIEMIKESELSELEIFNVLEFAQELSGNGIYPGVLTPLLVNARMRDMTLNPVQATEDTLAQAMLNPKDSEKYLQGFSQDFELQSQPYKRLLSYLGDMLSYDFTYESVNAKYSDYSSKAYQSDLDIVKQFFDKFDHKKEFAIATREMLRNEAFFSCTRFDGNKIVLQELPTSPEYTLITGRSPHCLLFSFNMYFFILPGIDINFYPDFFKIKFNEVMRMNGGKIPQYIPSLPPELRGDSSWVYWADIPIGRDPYGWCFKLNPEIATRVPYFSALFNDFIQQPLIRALQKNINMSAAARLVAGEIPMLKDTASKVKDAFSLTPKTLGQFLAFVKAAIGDSLKSVALPLTNVQALEFTPQNEVYSSYMKNAVAMSGVNSNLIFTSENRTNAIETTLSLGVDEQLMMKLYPQFNAFLNYNINARTKKFKFNFMLEGTNNYTNRQQRLEPVMGLVPSGIILPQKIAAAIGVSPFTFQRQLDEARANVFVDNLTPIVPATQISGGGAGDKGGRPQKSDIDLGEEGVNTRGNSGNERG